MVKLLFVCSENKLRSATGEVYFSQYPEMQAIGCGTNLDAPTVVTGNLVEWADIIFAMEVVHKRKVVKKFGDLLQRKKVVCLDIKDNYEFMDSKLIDILKRRVKTTYKKQSAQLLKLVK